MSVCVFVLYVFHITYNFSIDLGKRKLITFTYFALASKLKFKTKISKRKGTNLSNLHCLIHDNYNIYTVIFIFPVLGIARERTDCVSVNVKLVSYIYFNSCRLHKNKGKKTKKALTLRLATFRFFWSRNFW